jgi:hypothetical protein
MKLATFIILQVIKHYAGGHPDCTAYDTWKELQKLVEYHGNLMIRTQVMCRN